MFIELFYTISKLGLLNTEKRKLGGYEKKIQRE